MHIKNFDPYDFSKKEIDGVPVYYKNLPWAPCINISVAFNTGAFSDPVGKEGLSHFLEHLIFDGSSKFKDKKVVREWSKKYALNSWNAYTNFYETVYHLKCLPENYKKVLEGMKDMIFSPNLKKQDVEHERGVITQESWRRYKNEKFLTYTKEVIDNLYHGHNYSRVGSPLGWPETINKISQLDVKKWHTEKYVKSNMSIVLVGAVEEKDLGLIKDFIKNLPNKVVDKYEKGEVKKPKKLKIVKESEEIGDPNEQAEITIYRSMPYLPESRMAIVTLFRVLVSDLLNEKLRFEKGLCYWVRMSTWLFTDVSEIFMNIKTDEKNINLVQKEFWKIIREIKLGKYKNKFNTLKKVNIEQIKSRELISEDVADGAIRDLIRHNRITPLFYVVKEMEAVTYKDVANFTKEVFDPKWTFTEIILPSKK